MYHISTEVLNCYKVAFVFFMQVKYTYIHKNILRSMIFLDQFKQLW
jgi:hypothetical protein